MWADLKALSALEAQSNHDLTPLERNLALTVFSSMALTDFLTFADSEEEREARDVIDTLISKLLEVS